MNLQPEIGQRVGSVVVLDVVRGHSEGIQVVIECDCGWKSAQRWGHVRSRYAGRACTGNHRGRMPKVTKENALLNVRAVRGPASDYLCVDCYRAADSWTLSPDYPGATWYVGKLGSFSMDAEAYVPACRSCIARRNREAQRRAILAGWIVPPRIPTFRRAVG